MLQPLELWVINAGQGTAYIDPERANATSIAGSRGGFGVDLPPQIAGGRKGRVVLFPTAAVVQEPPVGEEIEIAIPYRGAGADDRVLEPAIRQVRLGRWKVELRKAR